MRLQMFAGALALAGSSSAFSDSSPLVLLSTSPLNDALSSDQLQIQTSSKAISHSREFLQTCPTDRYLLVKAPGLHATDLEPADDCKITQLCEAAKDSRIKGRYTVAQVVGGVVNQDTLSSASSLPDDIKAACEKQGKTVTVEQLELPALSKDNRKGALTESDGVLAKSLGDIASDDSYTILVMSTLGEPAYEPEFDDAMHTDLRRQVGNVQREGNSTAKHNQSLFDKYQFFTPGIFMALVTVIVLYFILYVGVKALGSLEIPYGAFDKEMGPSQQKKQQ